MGNTESIKYVYQTRGVKRENKLGHYPYIDYIQISTLKENVYTSGFIGVTSRTGLLVEFFKVQPIGRVVQGAPL